MRSRTIQSHTRLSRPAVDSPEQLLDFAIHELAASWDGTTKRIAIVDATKPAPLPAAYWMSRDEAAEHTLRFAQTLAKAQPKAKAMFERMATEMLNPAAAGRLQFSLATPIGPAMGNLDGDALTELNRRGSLPEAVEARKQFISAQAELMAECLASNKEKGGPAGVIIIADPADPRAAATAYILNRMASEMTGEDDVFGDTPVVVLSPIPRATIIFEKTRPTLARWLDRAVPAGSTRVICMAHGGETCTTGKLDVSVRKVPQPSP